MKSIRIFKYVFLTTAIFSAIYLVTTINDSIQQSQRIIDSEKEIIAKLELIRQLQMAHVTTKGYYTDNWDSLISFTKNDVFYLIEKEEKIFQLSYGADSVQVTYDTLGTVPVYDSLIANKTKFDIDRIAYVPGYQNVKFNIVAGKIMKSGRNVDVIEVWNPKPVNPARDPDSEYRSKKPLRFGSQFSVTTSGNWE